MILIRSCVNNLYINIEEKLSGYKPTQSQTTTHRNVKSRILHVYSCQELHFRLKGAVINLILQQPQY